MFRLGVYDGVPWKAGESVAIDAGANIGLVTRQLAATARHVYAIEADPDLYAVLECNRKYNRWPNVSTFNFALSDQNGEAVLHRLEANPLGASIFHDWQEDSVAVPARSLDCFMTEQGIEQVDLLKLDIEGAEHAVIASEGFARMAPRIKSIVLECHFIADTEIRSRLWRLGFEEVIRPFVPNVIHLYTRCRQQ